MHVIHTPSTHKGLKQRNYNSYNVLTLQQRYNYAISNPPDCWVYIKQEQKEQAITNISKIPAE